MREALTVIGFLIIVAFSALLAAPLFVDWNDWRETVAQRLADSIGAPVLIEGPIEARILPQPWLSITGLKIGEPGGSTTLSIEQAEADISLSALFQGSVVLSNVTLDRPRLTLVAGSTGALAPLVIAPGDRTVSVESFQISNGSVNYEDASASMVVRVEEIGLIGDARSLSGPFKAEGGLMIDGRRHSVNVSGNAATGEGLAIKLALAPVDQPITFDFDGIVKTDATGPQFDGQASIARPLPQVRTEEASEAKPPAEKPWKVTAKVTARTYEVKAPSIEVQIGPDESPVKFTGDGSMVLGAQPSLTMRLNAAQIEFDRLAGAKPDARMPPLAVIQALRGIAPEIALPSMPAEITLSADGAVLGGLALTDIKADLATSRNGWQVKTLSAGLPGRTRLSFAGAVLNAGKVSVDGRLEIDARQASALLAWLEGVSRPAAPNAAQRLSLTGAVKIGEEGLSFEGLKLGIDEATAEGRFALKPGSQGATGQRLEADLTANQLNVDAFPSIAALMPGGRAISEADVKLRAQSITFGGIEAKTASGQISFEGDALAVQDVAIDDFGGASLSANGTIEGLSTDPTGAIAIRIDARDLTPVAKALERSALPKTFLTAFEQRAAAFSPAGGTVALSFGDTRRLTVDGRFGGSTVEASVELAGETGQEAIDASIKLDSLDAVRLVRQLGFSPLPITIAGRASFTLDIDGPMDASRRWTGRYEGGGLSVEGTGKIIGDFEKPAVDGRLKVGAPDVQAVAQLFGIPLAGILPGESLAIDTGFRAKDGRLALDDLTGVAMGSPVTGALTFEPTTPPSVGGRLAFETFDLDRLASLVSGSDLTATGAKGLWPEAEFASPPGTVMTGKVALTVDTLGLGPVLPKITQAKGVVTLLPGGTVVEGLAGTLAGGTVSGQGSLTTSAASTAFTGKIALKGVAVKMPAVTGSLEAALELQGTGRTISAVIGGLTGGGTAMLSGATLPQTAPDAFNAVVTAVDAAEDAARVDVAGILRQALDAGPMPIGDVGGSVSLANGQLRLATTAAAAAPVRTTVSGAIDLNNLTASANVLVAPAAPADGFGGAPPDFTIKVLGTQEGLARDLETSKIAAWATIRAAERAEQKLQVLQAEQQAREAKAAEERRLEAERIQRSIEAAKAEEARKKAAQEEPLLAPVPVPDLPSPVPAAPVEPLLEPSAPPVAEPAPTPPASVEPQVGVDQGRAPSETGGAILDPEPLPPTSTVAPEPAVIDPPPLPPLPPPIEIRRAPVARPVAPSSNF